MRSWCAWELLTCICHLASDIPDNGLFEKHHLVIIPIAYWLHYTMLVNLVYSVHPQALGCSRKAFALFATTEDVVDNALNNNLISKNEIYSKVRIYCICTNAFAIYITIKYVMDNLQKMQHSNLFMNTPEYPRKSHTNSSYLTLSLVGGGPIRPPVL